MTALIESTERTNEHDINLDHLKSHSAIPGLFMQYIPSLRRAGSGYMGRCPQPSHRDTNPSFSLFQSSDGAWLGKCHRCRNTINIFQLLELKGIAFPEAKVSVSQYLGLSKDKPEKETLTSTAKRYNKPATIARFGEAEAYLKEHGVSSEVARLHDVGVDDFIGVGPCITFPYNNDNVKLRGLQKKEFRHYPGTSTAGLIYNLEALCHNPKELFITESERDCLMMVSHGFPAISVSSATAFMNSDGTLKFSSDEIAKIQQVDNVYIAVDQDEAGKECAAALQQELPHAKILTWTYRGLESGDAKDVGEIFTNDRENFSARIAQLCVEAPAPEILIDVNIEPTAVGGFPLTDAGNGERLVAEHGDNIRYLNDERGWRIWNGKRWNADATSEVPRLAKDTIRKIMLEAARTKDADHELRKALTKWSVGCESRSRLENMVALASREEKVSTNSSEFDQSPWLFNCANGTLDLESNTFREARRDELLSKQSPIIYDPRARRPQFDKFLEEILPSPKIRRFLQASLGYTLSGHAWEKFIWFLIGESGDNGKTSFVETIRHVFGREDYAANMNFNSLMPREGQGPNGDIARLRGIRFASASESDKGQKLSTAQVKRQTGGDRLTAAFKFKDEFEFTPSHKIWLATNYPPTISAEDDAVWNRIARVPFDVSVPLEKQDRSLRDKLKLEGAGILNWIFEGWKIYRAEGLKLPEEVRGATDSYREDQDVVKEFLKECVIPGLDDIGSTALYLDFKRWFAQSHNQRQQPMTQKAFSSRMERLGHAISRRNTGNFICGVGRLVSASREHLNQQHFADSDEPFA
jgi:putative DNA primase/helicase